MTLLCPQRRVLVLIYAPRDHGGFKQQPLAVLGGATLLRHTAGNAMGCTAAAAVAVATDDPECAAEAAAAGVAHVVTMPKETEQVREPVGREGNG